MSDMDDDVYLSEDEERSEEAPLTEVEEIHKVLRHAVFIVEGIEVGCRASALQVHWQSDKKSYT